MNKKILTIGLLTILPVLTACESMRIDSDDISRIRSQRDVDAYNATVTATEDKLMCTREQVIGTNIRQFICMTVAQRERLREESRQDAAFLSRTLIRTGGAPQ